MIIRMQLVLVACAAIVLPTIQARGQQSADTAPAVRGDHIEELSESYRVSRATDVEYQKVAPFKLFDNLYYVGPGFVSAWVIPTSAGLILIDTAQEPYVDHLIASIRKVGFDPKNIKYILISHGHVDHFGGAARIQELSGARVGALTEDWDMIAAAGAAPPSANGLALRVPQRDLVFKDGDVLTLGNTTLKLYKMPGHTPGSLSAELTVYDAGKGYKAFMFGGPGGPTGGGVPAAQGFLESTNRLGAIQGVQVAVQVHGWLTDPRFRFPNGGIFERAQALARRRPGEPNPFVDPDSWSTWVKRLQDGAMTNLEDQRRKLAN